MGTHVEYGVCTEEYLKALKHRLRRHEKAYPVIHAIHLVSSASLRGYGQCHTSPIDYINCIYHFKQFGRVARGNRTNSEQTITFRRNCTELLSATRKDDKRGTCYNNQSTELSPLSFSSLVRSCSPPLMDATHVLIEIILQSEWQESTDSDMGRTDGNG